MTAKLAKLRQEVRHAIGGCPDRRCAICSRQTNAVLAILRREVAISAKGKVGKVVHIAALTCDTGNLCKKNMAPCCKRTRRVYHCRRVRVVEEG